VPLLARPGWHYVCVSGKAEERPGAPAARPEVCDMPERQRLDQESELAKALSHELLAALIRGGDGAAGKQITSQLKGL